VKITDVESIVLRLPEVKRIGDGAQSILLIRVHTDAGITGIGEAHSNPTVSKAIIEAPLCSISSCGLRELLVGENPLDIARLGDKIESATATYGRRGVFMHTLSGIDIALWDILGKATGQPIFRLLGGARRERVAVYASDLIPDEVGEAVELARRHQAAGYRAMKLGWGSLGQCVHEDLARVQAVRATVGDTMDLMVDVGTPMPFEKALRLARGLADAGAYFLEEPLAPDDLDGFRRLVAASPTPIATGEKLTARPEYVDLMERGGLRIIQPDVARVGGISESLRIATLAESRSVRMIPHCWSTDILVAATLHVIATLRDCPYLEYNVTANPLRRDLLAHPIRPQDGIVAVPTGPGLGIEINEETVRRYRVGG
jgi:L-alanine-DL-glutamate epimerase-like enolase superfamily enzyme